MTTPNNELLNKYKEDGFIILRDFISASKIKDLEEAIKSQITFHMKKNNLEISDEFYNNGMIKMNALRKNKNNFDSVQVIYNLIRKLPELYKIVGDKELINVVKLLSGLEKNQSPYIWEAFCRIDPPKDSTFDLNWHQESYFTIPNSNSVQLWAPIINNVDLLSTGTMSALKGSAKLGEIKHHILKKENYIHEGILEKEIEKINLESINFELSPGDILLFHENLIHKTYHNTGSKVRFTMIANYSNPYLSKFNFMNEEEVVLFHKMRTGNADQNKEYIKSFSKKGGIKNFLTA
jgi:ectoine hydroxylase-related dioxygenase (phytanoyl-CoA dioxygenase family)